MFSRGHFRTFAWWVLCYTVLVILWGAYVRATGSGAGCGDHWPLCNGEIIPRDPSSARIIEFSHRLTSGFSLVLVVVMFFWSRNLYPSGSPVRAASAMALLFMIGEALVGAALVILQLVAGNDSALRALVIAGHLVNTFLLLFWLAKTVYLVKYSSFEKNKIDTRLQSTFRLCLGAFIITGAVGAIVALGDTLFPAQSLSQALTDELSSSSHFLVKLRIWHPLVAVLTSVYILIQCVILPYAHKSQTLKKSSLIVGGLIILQLAGGVLNWLLLAPVPMQLFHLGLADITWIALCFWYFSVLYPSEERV